MCYMLDTNVIIYILQGRYSEESLRQLENGEKMATSVICQLECYAFSELTEADKKLLNEFFASINIIGLLPDDNALMEQIVKIRQERSLKLPDAIVYSTALNIGATLLTYDENLLKLDRTSKEPC